MKENRIMLDMTMLSNPYTGLGQFSLYLGNYLLNNNKSKNKYDFLLTSKIDKNIFNCNEYNVKYFNFLRKKMSDIIPSLLYPNYKIWHVLSQQSQYFPSHNKFCNIFTIHDLNFLKEENDELIDRKMYFIQKRIHNSDVITTISNYAANDIKRNFNLNGKNIEIIYNGVEIKKYFRPKIPKFITKTNKIIFSIGTITEKKNFHVLIPMMKYLPEYTLVIAGKKENEYANKIESDISRYDLTNNVILAGEINDEDKYWLYEKCDAFVFPSLLEGFGMPIIEALSMGKPVFSSLYTSLPEIGGDIVNYWHSFQPKYMSDFFLKNLKIRNEDHFFEEKAINRAKSFSWNLAVNQYQSLYNKLL
ncbi:MAG: glycosyltransferase family 1 protein [Bacteroidetes bacterium]|nr:MAG: glycosyltransferase family 1 protein [Bacteroidota bacterium]